MNEAITGFHSTVERYRSLVNIAGSRFLDALGLL